MSDRDEYKHYWKSVEKSCNGKVKHRTFEDARSSLVTRKRVRRSGRGGVDKTSGKIVVYRCPNPEPFTHYHIGKRPRPDARPYNRKRDVPPI